MSFLKQVIVMLLFGKYIESGNTPNCEAGWNGWNGKCYNLYEIEENFFTASFSCQKENSALASVSSKEENAYLNIFIRNETNRAIYEEAWIGCKTRNKQCVWIDGIDNSYANWMSGRPRYSVEACTIIIPGGRWVDINCYKTRPFICKKDPIPTGTDDDTKFILLLTIPISCLLVMFFFVVFLCFKSHSELDRLQKDYSEEISDTAQATMVVPLQKKPFLLNNMQDENKAIWDAAKSNVLTERVDSVSASSSSDQTQGPEENPKETSPSAANVAGIVNNILKLKHYESNISILLDDITSDLPKKKKSFREKVSAVIAGNKLIDKDSNTASEENKNSLPMFSINGNHDEVIMNPSVRPSVISNDKNIEGNQSSSPSPSKYKSNNGTILKNQPFDNNDNSDLIVNRNADLTENEMNDLNELFEVSNEIKKLELRIEVDESNNISNSHNNPTDLTSKSKELIEEKNSKNNIKDFKGSPSKEDSREKEIQVTHL